jgi:hypothetical protein
VANVTGLPFPIPYYGHSYDEAWVSTSGVATFIDPAGEIPGWKVSLPDRVNGPRAAVAPFWDDLVIDDLAGVYTGVVGAGAEQRYVIEWRNVRFLQAAETARFSFEAVFSPRGDITFNYAGVVDDRTSGISAAVGITSLGGGYGLQYSFRSNALVSGTAITFTYPEDPHPIPYGSLSGIATSEGVPLDHATVLLDNFHATTDSSGHYRFESVEAGTYGLGAVSGCDAANAPDVVVDGDTTADLSLTPFVDGFGYSCGIGPADWIPGVNVLSFTEGSDTIVQFPFALPFYGSTFTGAIVSPAGDVYLRHPDEESGIGGDLESWLGQVHLDAQSSVRTTTVGQAPNRRVAIEWRGLILENPAGVRITFEMVFAEDGTVTMAYQDLFDTRLLPQPIRLFFYSLSDELIDYIEDGRGFPQGRAVIFRPPSS